MRLWSVRVGGEAVECKGEGVRLWSVRVRV